MNTKQVIVMRTDLGMRKGKMIAQGAHASMAVLLNRGNFHEQAVDADLYFTPKKKLTCDSFELQLSDWPAGKEWLQGIFTKIVVGIDSEQGLLDLEKKAKEHGLPCALIQDSGLTEFHGVPTYTALAIGPAEVLAIDEITSHLKLL